MKNQTNLIKRIRNIIVGNTLPANEDLWLDTSEGEKKGVLKYKGNPIVGGGSNSDYSSTKQTVTLFDDTIETQGSHGVYQGVVENIDFAIVAGENYTVIFDGTSYDVKAAASPTYGGYICIGETSHNEYSFETYPFYIECGAEEGVESMFLATNIEGSHVVIIKHEEETITPTPEFKGAVNSVIGYSIDTKYSLECENNSFLIPEEKTYFNLGFYEYLDIALSKGATYKITFGGIEYELIAKENVDYFNKLYIGELSDSANNLPSFDNYPFCIQSDSDGTYAMIIVPQYGTYSVKIESFIESIETTSKFVSMIQGIAGGSDSGCQIIYPDEISWTNNPYSQYNKAPEAGNIYFIPFADSGSTDGRYLYPVYIDELTSDSDSNEFSGFTTIIGNPIIIDNGTLTAQPFNRTINPESGTTKGLCIAYIEGDNNYRLGYGDMMKL